MQPRAIPTPGDGPLYALTTHTRALDVPHDVDLAQLPVHLANCLGKKKARSVTVEGDCVTFRGGACRWVTNWNVLVPFGFGDFRVDSANQQVEYRVSFLQLVVLVGIVPIVGAIFLVAQGMLEGPLIAIAVWFCAVLLNLAIGLPRFHYFALRSIASAPRLKS